MRDLRDAVAFITGGSSGIGLGIAEAFLEAGMLVAFTYRSAPHRDEALSRLGKSSRVHAIRLNVSDRNAMTKAAAEMVDLFGKVHVLVNNAGVQLLKPLMETSYEEWDELMAVNLDGVFNGLRAFLPHIREHGEGGHIVTTSSVLGLFAGRSIGAYTASKFALVGLTESLRAELDGQGIGVSLLCPGVVESNLDAVARERAGDPSLAAATSDPEFGSVRVSPRDVGQQVLQGIKNDAFYILTHPEMRDLYEIRHRALMSHCRDPLSVSSERQEFGRRAAATSFYAGLVETMDPPTRLN
jgi:NAD(P)-dependent dehydrogenase (short-subunit alcohol dehydrogenase family)